MGFSVQVTFAAKGESPFTLRVAQPKVGAPLVAKKVLKSFALGYEKKCGTRLDVGSLRLTLDPRASAPQLAPGADVRAVASDGSTLFVVRQDLVAFSGGGMRLVALIASHVASESRLEHLIRTLYSARQQSTRCRVALSWSVETENLRVISGVE